jgi:hypothetical protein
MALSLEKKKLLKSLSEPEMELLGKRMKLSHNFRYHITTQTHTNNSPGIEPLTTVFEIYFQVHTFLICIRGLSEALVQ